MILFLSAYPPRECGMASYTYHLIEALKDHFDATATSPAVEICALDQEQTDKCVYPAEVRYRLNTADQDACRRMAQTINNNPEISAVCIQHRFGLWGGERWGENLLHFMQTLQKPLAITLHKVLPEPEPALWRLVKAMQEHAAVLITQTKYHADTLMEHYGVPEKQVRIIPPGAPVVTPFNKDSLKAKHKLEGKLVLTTFGYLRRSKGIEQVLEALDIIRQSYPEAVYLILGKTHPTAARFEGERYRIQLKDLIFRKGLQKNVRFVNRHLRQDELQEYMCLSDVYLHTSKTNLSSLMLAVHCGVPVISNLAPATQELVQAQGTIANFASPASLVQAVEETLQTQELLPATSLQAVVTADHFAAWPNVAGAYQEIFAEIIPRKTPFQLPNFKPDYLYLLTTAVGLQSLDQQKSPLGQQVYLLKDNAKALVAALQWFKAVPEQELLMLMLMRRFLNVIRKCQQPDGTFLSQLDEQGDRKQEQASPQQVEESSMQAMWALAHLIKGYEKLPADMPVLAQRLFVKAMPQFSHLKSLRATAFAIKALYHYQAVHPRESVLALLDKQAARLHEAFVKTATNEWGWFEQDLAEDNSLLPDALLLAAHATGNAAYRKTALQAFNFLLDRYFVPASPAKENEEEDPFASEEQFVFNEQPLEVCYTIRALSFFYQQTGEQQYLRKLVGAFSWFMGNNSARQALYDASTGACHDGLWQGKLCHQQGAQSLVSYLLSRLIMEKHFGQVRPQLPHPMPVRKHGAEQNVQTAQDRPSMPSGKVKVLAN